jgi:hypothetical protein
MADIKGSGLSWAVAGFAFTAGIIPAANETPAIQSLRAQKSPEGITYIKGSDGKVVTCVIPDIKTTLSVSVIPTATTLALAKTLMDRFFIAPGTKVTVTDSEGNTEGNYYVAGCSQARTVDGAVVCDVELENFITDISTSAA